MLEMIDIHAGYSGSQVLNGLSLAMAEGEVATLLGRNGMGKTTTIRCLFGQIRPSSGKILINGKDMSRAAAHEIARTGLGLVPEGRQIFPTLSVEENLIATARQTSGAKAMWDLHKIYALFPRLYERRRNGGNQLSGGEQQMLAIGRALMTNPRLLVLDEATEGLAPLIRQEIWDCLSALRAAGLSILVIDKNIAALSKLADRHHVIERGEIVWQGDTTALLADHAMRARYLHV